MRIKYIKIKIQPAIENLLESLIFVNGTGATNPQGTNTSLNTCIISLIRNGGVVIPTNIIVFNRNCRFVSHLLFGWCLKSRCRKMGLKDSGM